MDWTNVVYRIEGTNDAHRGQGTGFAIGRDADGALLVVTCWHVVRGIGRDNLRVKGLSCTVVSSDGDDDLDLAVLCVAGLASDGQLSLAARGEQGMPFDTYGYEPIGRPLSGELGADTSRPHVSFRDVPAWDYYLRDGARELEKIKDGYSGAPVCDRTTGAVVAVITHRQGADKGFAIDIANLPRVYPQAAACIAAGRTEADGEYATETDNPLAKILDHTDQLASIRELVSDAAADRAIALVEACADDWPSYLADHVLLAPWPDADGSPPEAISLGLKRFDEQAFWEAFIEAVPHASHAPDDEARRATVRGWINGARLRVLYVPVALARHGRQLPGIIRGAEATLADLGAFAPGTRVLVLIACVRKADRAPFWWPLYARFKLASLGCCFSVDAMRPLEKPDIEDWYAGFPHSLRLRYNRDQLKAELLALFEPRRSGIRYEQARRRLVDEGAIRRARTEP